jgi:hypothetical protein
VHDFAVADDLRTARAVFTAVRPPAANAVGLYVEDYGRVAPTRLELRLPLDFHKLHGSAGKFGGDVTTWNAIFRGGGEGWALMVFEGSKASAADRAAIERALRSIRRAS